MDDSSSFQFLTLADEQASAQAATMAYVTEGLPEPTFEDSCTTAGSAVQGSRAGHARASLRPEWSAASNAVASNAVMAGTKDWPASERQPVERVRRTPVPLRSSWSASWRQQQQQQQQQQSLPFTGHTSGRKLFRCPMCPKMFGRRTGMVAHIRVHTGEKPFQCAFCTRSFSDKSNARRHMLTHAGQEQ